MKIQGWFLRKSCGKNNLKKSRYSRTLKRFIKNFFSQFNRFGNWPLVEYECLRNLDLTCLMNSRLRALLLIPVYKIFANVRSADVVDLGRFFFRIFLPSSQFFPFLFYFYSRALTLSLSLIILIRNSRRCNQDGPTRWRELYKPRGFWLLESFQAFVEDRCPFLKLTVKFQDDVSLLPAYHDEKWTNLSLSRFLSLALGTHFAFDSSKLELFCHNSSNTIFAPCTQDPTTLSRLFYMCITLYILCASNIRWRDKKLHIHNAPLILDTLKYRDIIRIIQDFFPIYVNSKKIAAHILSAKIHFIFFNSKRKMQVEPEKGEKIRGPSIFPNDFEFYFEINLYYLTRIQGPPMVLEEIIEKYKNPIICWMTKTHQFPLFVPFSFHKSRLMSLTTFQDESHDCLGERRLHAIRRIT